MLNEFGAQYKIDQEPSFTTSFWECIIGEELVTGYCQPCMDGFYNLVVGEICWPCMDYAVCPGGS